MYSSQSKGDHPEDGIMCILEPIKGRSSQGWDNDMYFSQSKGDHPEDGIMICTQVNQREIIPRMG